MAALPWTLLLVCLSALHHGDPSVSASDLEEAQRNILQVRRGQALSFPPHILQSLSGDEPLGETPEGDVVLQGPDPLLTTTAVPGTGPEIPEDPLTPTLLPSSFLNDAPFAGGEILAGEVEGLDGQGWDGHENSSEALEDTSGPGCEGHVPPKAMSKAARGMMKLGTELLREAERQSGTQENIFFSPFSISLALAHLALGAENETEQQLLEVLHAKSMPCFHQAMHRVSQHLNRMALSLATSLYLEKGFPVKEKFLEDSERFYGAKPSILSGNSEADLEAINHWVKEATNGQIPAMLSELPASVVMILLNAIHFQGFWKTKFDPQLTELSTFHLDNEFTISVEMMKAQVYPLSWFTVDPLDVQIARFPFKGNTSFVAIVPNHFEGNFSQLLSKLSQADLRNPFPKERPTMVKMPKLSLHHRLDLNRALSRLGLGELFSSPNLSGIAEGPLVVSSIQHEAALELTEAGVEASAATSVVMSRSLSAFHLNRPFLFIIFEDTLGVPLFFGSIRNPNPSAPRQRKMSDCIRTSDGDSSGACLTDSEKP
ncbi:alpha-2-antiplasmin isoform X2 [Sceloporus undulatus]|uniref:alpha-2-antiplasmin isoform X2 n=1 Tax=Sceloporus undulatus TaxID=8520 RepID=UPI001C4D0DD3|nr:alpha-2-antiplasmin isoform X2 [Sceloporus undulatus]